MSVALPCGDSQILVQSEGRSHIKSLAKLRILLVANAAAGFTDMSLLHLTGLTIDPKLLIAHAVADLTNMAWPYLKGLTKVPELLVGDGLDRGGVDGPGAVLGGQSEGILCHHCLASAGVGSHKDRVALL